MFLRSHFSCPVSRLYSISLHFFSSILLSLCFYHVFTCLSPKTITSLITVLVISLCLLCLTQNRNEMLVNEWLADSVWNCPGVTIFSRSFPGLASVWVLPFLSSSYQTFSEACSAGFWSRLHGHEFEQALEVGDEQGRLACCSPWDRKSVRHSWATELNWTEVNKLPRR